jgi:hypothetical protein
MALQEAVALRLPTLRWPSWATWTFIASLFLAVASLVAAGKGVVPWPVTGLVAMGSIGTLILLTRLDPRSELPRDVQTVGDLARRVLSLNVAELRRSREVSEADVRAAVVEIICEELGVSREQAVPRAEFVRDLGVD